MKPDTHTVQQLFERDVRYIVPLYQRPYVWDEEHQWAPLWDDLAALLSHQESGDTAGLWSHFLGAIVLDQAKTLPGQIPQYTVIDGQQRLTTLQLLVVGGSVSAWPSSWRVIRSWLAGVACGVKISACIIGSKTPKTCPGSASRSS
jgi:hypothetical protein